jgi:peroxiredoxin
VLNVIRRQIKQNLFAAILLVLANLVSSMTALALDEGALAPDFELPGVQGTLKLSQLQGKAVYLDFWASWCGPCRESFPWMNAMQEKYRQQGLEVIAINLDERHDDAKKFLDKHATKFTVLFDPKGKTPSQFGVMGMPTSFIIGKSGKVLLQHAGFNDDERAELEQRLKSALEGSK